MSREGSPEPAWVPVELPRARERAACSTDAFEMSRESSRGCLSGVESDSDESPMWYEPDESGGRAPARIRRGALLGRRSPSPTRSASPVPLRPARVSPAQAQGALAELMAELLAESLVEKQASWHGAECGGKGADFVASNDRIGNCQGELQTKQLLHPRKSARSPPRAPVLQAEAYLHSCGRTGSPAALMGAVETGRVPAGPMGQSCSSCVAGEDPEDGSATVGAAPPVEASVVRVAEDSHARGEVIELSVANCLRTLKAGQALRVKVGAPCELLFAADGEHLVIAGAGELVNVHQEARVRFSSDEVLGDDNAPSAPLEEVARADDKNAGADPEDAAQSLSRAKLTRATDGPTRRRLSSLFELKGEARV